MSALTGRHGTGSTVGVNHTHSIGPLVAALLLGAVARADDAPAPRDESAATFVIPGGREDAIRALVAPLYAQPPAGIVPGDMAVTKDRVRVSLTIGGKPAEVFLLHPTTKGTLPNEQSRAGGEDAGLTVATACDRCSDESRAALASVAEAMVSAARAKPQDLWLKVAPPAPRPPPKQPVPTVPGPKLPPMPEFEPLVARRSPLQLLAILAPLALAAAVVTVLVRGRRRRTEQSGAGVSE